MFTKILTSALLFLIAIGGFFVSITKDIRFDGVQTYALENARTDGGVAPAVTPPKPSEAESKWLNDVIQAVNVALGVLTVIASPAIIFAGWLMSPDWTSGDLFGLREPMHNMWIIVSNIVYFIYAILLIIIALATIFGKENFSYKAMIPRLALGILMVPFTWWFVQWTISLATVVTASVINIPMDMISEKNELINAPIIPKNYYVTTVASGSGTKTINSDSTQYNEFGENKCDATTCISAKEMLSKGGGAYSTLMIYAYQVFRIQDYKDVSTELNTIKTAGQLLNNLLIGAIMFLVFGLLVMALIAMLLLRAIKLWMYAIFSPLFTLHFVAGKELFGKSTEGFDLKEFIGLCFVPAVVGLSLSFGLMIISVVQAPSNNSTSNTTSQCDLNSMQISGDKVTGGCTLINMFGNSENKITRGIVSVGNEKWVYNVVSIAGVNIFFKGQASSTNLTKIQESTNNIKGGLSAVGGIFGTLIVDIIALIFIWMAFMAAKGISKAVDAAVQPFEDMGKKVGSMAASIPKYTPIPGLGMSASGMQQVMSKLETNIDQKQREKLADTPLGKLVGMDSKLARAYSELEAQAKKEKVSMTELESARKAATEIIASKGLGSKEGQNAMDKLKQVAMKNDTLSTQIKNAKLYNTDGSITLAGEQLLEGNLKSTSGWSNQTLANDEVVKKWKSPQENYNGPTGGTNGSTSGNSPVNINITSNNGNAEYSLGDQLKGFKDRTKFIEAIKKNDTAIQNIKTEDIEAALKASSEFKAEVDDIIRSLKKVRNET